MRRRDLGPLDARRFRTGRASIDFLHTGGEGQHAVWELLHAPIDLERWLPVIVDADVLDANADDLVAARRLRAAMRRVAEALVAGRHPAATDVAVVNAAAAEPPLVPELTDHGIRLLPGSVAQALATLARDLQDLAAGPLSARVRVCAADDCGLLFVDASRPGRRRWCSMQRCGNRAKTKAHRARKPAR